MWGGISGPGAFSHPGRTSGPEPSARRPRKLLRSGVRSSRARPGRPGGAESLSGRACSGFHREGAEQAHLQPPLADLPAGRSEAYAGSETSSQIAPVLGKLVFFKGSSHGCFDDPGNLLARADSCGKSTIRTKVCRNETLSAILRV